MRFFISLAALALVSMSFSVHAVATNDVVRNDFIEGSYIVTFKPQTTSKASLITAPSKKDDRLGTQNPPPFGEHGTGQSKEQLGATLGLAGNVVRIFESMNAAHIKMDASEADRLRKHPDVLSVTQDRKLFLQTVQSEPGWALDRMDQASPILDQTYTYSSNGAGQTVYVLDTGLNLDVPAVAAEYGGRAFFRYDVTNGNGHDCVGHGSEVASLIGSNTWGVAKGVTLQIVRINPLCDGVSDKSTWMAAFNWLAANAPRGTIANLSSGITLYNIYSQPICATTDAQRLLTIDGDLDNAIILAHNAGIITVVSAGNDGCDTANYSPTHIPQAFVVGATDQTVSGFDAKTSYSRTGWNISTFAPGTNSVKLDQNGFPHTWNEGTSYAAPLISGVFAVACQYLQSINYNPTCATAANATAVYDALKTLAATDTVTNPGGGTLIGATSRFVWKRNW